MVLTSWTTSSTKNMMNSNEAMVVLLDAAAAFKSQVEMRTAMCWVFVCWFGSDNDALSTGRRRFDGSNPMARRLMQRAREEIHRIKR